MTCLTVCCYMSMTKQETQKCPLSQNFNKSLYHLMVSWGWGTQTVSFFHVKCKYEQNDCALDKIQNDKQ